MKDVKLKVELLLSPEALEYEPGDAQPGEWLPPKTLMQAIVAAAGRELAESLRRDMQDQIFELEQSVRQVVDRIAEEEARPKVQDIVRKGVPKLQYGVSEEDAPRITVEAMTVEWLKSGRDRYSSSSNLQEITKSIVQEHLRAEANELEALIKEEREKLREAVRTRLGDAVVEALRLERL